MPIFGRINNWGPWLCLLYQQIGSTHITLSAPPIGRLWRQLGKSDQAPLAMLVSRFARSAKLPPICATSGRGRRAFIRRGRVEPAAGSIAERTHAEHDRRP